LKVVLYYYRASRTFEQNDITITTLVACHRFKVCSGLAIVCPISATVHVKPSATHALLDAFHDLCVSSPSMSTYVDIYLAFTPSIEYFAECRVSLSRTESAMMLDVDFAICTNF
ncbi:hypothetical protein BDR03DRAFT_800861, partial [Suillus americanus]